MFDEERYARLGLAIEGNIDRVKAWIFKFELLDVDDEISRAEMHVVRKSDFDGNGREIGHDGMSIGIDEIQTQGMFALVTAKESDAEGDGALGMNGGELLSVNGVKRA